MTKKVHDNSAANQVWNYAWMLSNISQLMLSEMIRGDDPSLEREGYTKEEIKMLGELSIKNHSESSPRSSHILKWYAAGLTQGRIDNHDLFREGPKRKE